MFNSFQLWDFEYDTIKLEFRIILKDLTGIFLALVVGFGFLIGFYGLTTIK